MTSHPLFEIVTTTAGALSIRNKAVNEIMHNPVGPWAEANRLYIEQSRLKDRFAQAKKGFAVFDIGLGAAANAVAALSAIESVDSKNPFHMVSFEQDLELLKFTLANAEYFPHIQKYQSALTEILENGIWKSENILWELRTGDFVKLIEQEPTQAQLVFFDPYSPEVNQDMWTISTFKKLKARCKDSIDEGATLYTYSQATRIRAALIEAGFFVGYGVSTGLKKETTEAATKIELLNKPLGQEWHKRWSKSHLRYPFDCSIEHRPTSEKQVNDYFQRLN
jgi:tRNA U34 5-methylaminomethyl-2-thiouridine-forming methyltransferase MnmC